MTLLPTFYEIINYDGFVKSLKRRFSVIPAPHQVRDKLQPESGFFN